MKQLLSLFLFLLPCLAWAQYPSNGNQKITLGEQTTADGIIWRGVSSDTTLTAKSDTAAYFVLDTVNKKLYFYKVSATPKWNEISGSGGGSSGTVTSITGGTGLTGGTITTSGTLAADTSFLFTQSDTLGLNLTSRFASKQNNLTLTTTGTSGASTLINSTLNIPQYSGGGVDSTAIKYVNTYGTQTVNGLKTFGNNLSLKPSSGFTIMTQESPNVSHGVTGWLPNNAYSSATIEDTNNGGFSFVAATDAATPGALNFYGIMGSTTPTSNAINFRAAKKNGTSIQALGAAENAMVFNNYGGTDLLQFKGNGDAAFGKFIGGGTSGLSIDNTGTLVRTSSYELKKDITPIHYGLNEILLLNPINFNWVNSDKYGDNNENGFIAEDILSIIPNSVNTNGESIYMDYSKLIPVLTKAIQEQNALIKALEQRIINLENK